MYAVSNSFKLLSKENSRYVDIKCSIGDVEYTDITEFNMTRSVSSESEFQFGKMVASKLSIKIRKATSIQSHSKVIPYIRFLSDIENSYTDWLPLGHFYVDNRYYNKGIVSITAYDDVLYLDNIYDSKLKFPTKAKDIIDEISNKHNFLYDIDFDDITIELKPINYTERQIIEYISCCHSSSPFFNNDGVLKFNDYSIVDEEIDLSNATSQSIDDQSYTIRKIDCVKNKDITYTVGKSDGDYSTVSFENPFMTKEQFESRFKKYIGFKYYNSTIEKTSSGYFETADSMYCFDTSNTSNKAVIIISSIEIDFSNSGLFKETINSFARKPSDTDYTKTSDIESKIRDETKDLKDAVYYFENEGVLKFSTEMQELIRMRFTSNSECTPMFHANIIFKIDADGILEFEYIVDNLKHRVEPKNNVTIGYSTIHLFLPLYQTKGNSTHDIVVNVSSKSAIGSINKNQIQATVNGQGLEVLKNDWDGTIQVITEIEKVDVLINDINIKSKDFTTSIDMLPIQSDQSLIETIVDKIPIRIGGIDVNHKGIESMYGYSKVIIDEQVKFNYLTKQLFICDFKYVDFKENSLSLITEYIFDKTVNIDIDSGFVQELSINLEQFKSVESVMLEVE